MAPRYHAHAPAVPLPLALPLLALGPGFEKMFRANISTQHMLETFARLALHDDERHGRRVRRGRAATRDVPSCAPCAVRRLPATFLFLSVFLSCSFSRLISLCLLELAGATSSSTSSQTTTTSPTRRSDLGSSAVVCGVWCWCVVCGVWCVIALDCATWTGWTVKTNVIRARAPVQWTGWTESPSAGYTADLSSRT